jgi:hypothetical protein
VLHDDELSRRGSLVRTAALGATSDPTAHGLQRIAGLASGEIATSTGSLPETRLFLDGMSLAAPIRTELTTMTMLRFRKTQRAILVEKIPDLANLAAGALIFGQFVGGQRFSLTVAVVGLIAWAAMIGLTLAIAGDEEVR